MVRDGGGGALGSWGRRRAGKLGATMRWAEADDRDSLDRWGLVAAVVDGGAGSTTVT